MDVSWMPEKMRKRLANKGLGDIVKETIDFVSDGSIKQCGACKKRQQKLNDWMQFENSPPEMKPKKRRCSRCLKDLLAKIERKRKNDSSGD